MAEKTIDKSSTTNLHNENVLSRILQGYVVWKASGQDESILSKFITNTNVADASNIYGDTFSPGARGAMTDPLKELKLADVDTGFEYLLKKFNIKLSDIKFLDHITEQTISAKNTITENKYLASESFNAATEALFNFKKFKMPPESEMLKIEPDYEGQRFKESQFNPDIFEASANIYKRTTFSGTKATDILPPKRTFDLIVSSHQIAVENDKESIAGSKEHLDELFTGIKLVKGEVTIEKSGWDKSQDTKTPNNTFAQVNRDDRASGEALSKLKQGYSHVLPSKIPEKPGTLIKEKTKKGYPLILKPGCLGTLLSHFTDKWSNKEKFLNKDNNDKVI